MRMPALILGVILLIVGGLIAAGVFKYEDKNKAEIGPVALTVTREKTPPVNFGWVLIGVGAVAMVVGAASKK